METKICEKCGKEFEKSIFCSRKKWAERKFCSRSCANSVNSTGRKFPKGRIPWNKGKKLPKYTGKNNKRYSRVELICKQCGKKFTVKKYRENDAQFCSRKCHYKNIDKNKTDINHRARRGKEAKMWRELIFERDNWTCQKCFKMGKNLNAHHIENFATNLNDRFNIDNGITLCRKCHYKFHSKYGFRNNNNNQITKFLAVGKES